MSSVGLAVGLLATASVVASGPVSSAGASGSSSAKAELTQAKSELLVKSDFPKGWTSQGRPTTTSSNGGNNAFPGEAQLASCLGLSPALAGAMNMSTPEADSPTFQNSAQTDQVQESFDIYPTAKLAHEDYASMTLAQVPACVTSTFAQPSVKSQLASSFGSGFTLGTVTATAVSPDSLIAHTAGFALSIPVTKQGVTITVSLDFVGWAKGTANPALVFTSFGSPVSVALEKHLETVAYDRS